MNHLEFPPTPPTMDELGMVGLLERLADELEPKPDPDIDWIDFEVYENSEDGCCRKLWCWEGSIAMFLHYHGNQRLCDLLKGMSYVIQSCPCPGFSTTSMLKHGNFHDKVLIMVKKSNNPPLPLAAPPQPVQVKGGSLARLPQLKDGSIVRIPEVKGRQSVTRCVSPLIPGVFVWFGLHTHR